MIVDGWIWGMEYDWIGDTVYAVTDKGFVIACNTGAEQVIRCATVLSGLGTIRGVALNPTSGYGMEFWLSAFHALHMLMFLT